MIFFVIIFVIAIAIAFYVYYLSHGNYSEQTPSEQPPATNQPRHFDLLDENGDPIGAPNAKIVIGGDDSDAPVQELQYFCVKDKGYHVSVWPKNQGIQGLDYIEFNIAGITHCENVDGYLGEFKGTLEAEPTNEYDPNAIKILAADGHHVGYVPADMTSEIRDNATFPCQCFCYIGENDGVYFSDCYIFRPNVSPK
jgi:hypothetical protein